MKIILALFAMLMASPVITSAEESSRPASVPDQEKVDAFLFSENRSYEDWFVNQRAVHFKDTYIWVYTEAFAKDFRMPTRWIDKELKGADALAFHTEESAPLCGWNGKQNACSTSTNCLVDAYFHHARNVLPWDDTLRWTDMDIRSTSAFVLSSLQPLDRKRVIGSGSRSPFTDPRSGKELVWWLVGIPKVSPIGGSAFFRAYDRSIFNNYSLVVQDVFCHEIAGLELSAESQFDRPRTVHRSIVFPMSWRNRIRPVLQEVNAKSRSFFFEKLKELREEK